MPSVLSWVKRLQKPNVAVENNIRIPGSLIKVQEFFDSLDLDLVLVGGYVRDHFLGIQGTDIDIEVYGQVDMASLQNHLERFGSAQCFGKQFGVIKLQLGGYSYDFALPRIEQKTGDAHRDFMVQTDAGLDYQTAASRRDFTINSIGYRIKDGLILDPFDGITDIKQKRIRHIGPSFDEDALRVFRAMQFAARFGFQIDEETLKRCKTMSMSHLSKQRIEVELQKCLLSPKPSQGLRYFFDLGLGRFFSELSALDPNVWQCCLRQIDLLFDLGLDAELMVTLRLCVLSMIRPEQTDLFLNRFLGSKKRFGMIQSVIQAQDDLQMIKNKAQDENMDTQIRKLSTKVTLRHLAYLEQVRENAYQDVGFAEWFMNRARHLGVLDHAPQPIVTGEDLTKKGILPGKKMGEMLDALYQIQLAGEDPSKAVDRFII